MNIKDLVSYLKDPSKKIYLYTVIGVLIIFIIIIIVIFASIFGNKKNSYEQIEQVMISGAKNYARDKKLLKEVDEFDKEINIKSLINEKYIKELKKYNRKFEACTGKVIITYNDKDFLYTPYLECGEEYKTSYLRDVIKTSKISENKSGIYQIDDYYVYKGETPNNYISFAGGIWRIMKINSDGSIKIVQKGNKLQKIAFDDRYNSTCPKDEYDCRGFSNFETSRLKDFMIKLYKDGYRYGNYDIKFSDFEKTIINQQNICIGSISENLQLADGYPECNVLSTEKYPFDFVRVNEAIMPSLDSGCNSIKDKQCTNYNYMTDIYGWTATQSDKNNYTTYAIGNMPNAYKVSEQKNVIVSFNLSKNTLFESGNGTIEKPYLIRKIEA